MEIKLGDQYSKIFQISEKMVIDFADITGDRNPIHLDEEYAKKAFFGKRIVHGFLIGSQIGSVIGNDYPGNGTIYVTQNMRFLYPVFIGDTVKILIKVLEITKNSWLVLRTECFNQYNKLVLTGDATVIPPLDCTLKRI